MPHRCGRGAERSTTSAVTTGACWTWSWSACSRVPRATQGSEESQGFRAWESIAREVLTRSEGAPLLVVLEDLHWADTGSLRVLRRLIASSASGQGWPSY